MTDDELRAAVLEAIIQRGLTAPGAFAARYGVPLTDLTLVAALTLLNSPARVQEWLAVDDPTPCVWVPLSVRTYLAVFGLSQESGETDDAFVRRARVILKSMSGQV